MVQKTLNMNVFQRRSAYEGCYLTQTALRKSYNCMIQSCLDGYSCKCIDIDKNIQIALFGFANVIFKIQNCLRNTNWNVLNLKPNEFVYKEKS